MKRHTRSSQTRRANILKKVIVHGKWGLYPAVLEPNGRLKDKVRIKGEIEIHPEGTYYIEWREGGERKREAIPDRARVPDLAYRKALELQAAKAGLNVGSNVQNHGEKATLKIRLDDAIQQYLDDVKPPQREPKTYAAYKYSKNIRNGRTEWVVCGLLRAGTGTLSVLLVDR
jgi:integrase/recombinase XerD